LYEVFRPARHLASGYWVFREVDDSGMRSYRRGFGRNFKFLDPLPRLLHRSFFVNKQAVFINFAEEPGYFTLMVSDGGRCPLPFSGYLSLSSWQKRLFGYFSLFPLDGVPTFLPTKIPSKQEEN